MKILQALLFVSLCFWSNLSIGQHDFSSNELIQQGQYAQALTQLEKSALTDSIQHENLQQQAFCNYKLGRLAQAKKLYYLVLEKKPSSTETLLQIANIAEKNYNLAEALTIYQRLNQLDSNNTFYWKELARINIRMERAKQGIPYLKKAIELDGNDIESISSLANLYLNDSKDELAEPLISDGFCLDSTSIKIRHLRSRLSYRKGDFNAVKTDLCYTMSLGDSSSFYQRLLGNAYYRLDSMPQAKATFERLLSIGEDTEQVRAGLAFTLLNMDDEKKETIYEASSNFYQAINLGKSDRLSDYELGLADVSDKLGDTEEAIKRFQKVINRPRAVFRLAEIYEKKKLDKEMALLYYDEYIKACGRMKKPTADCNFIELATRRISNLKATNLIEASTISVSIPKDSVEMVADTIRKD